MAEYFQPLYIKLNIRLVQSIQDEMIALEMMNTREDLADIYKATLVDKYSGKRSRINATLPYRGSFSIPCISKDRR